MLVGYKIKYYECVCHTSLRQAQDALGSARHNFNQLYSSSSRAESRDITYDYGKYINDVNVKRIIE